MYVHIYYITIIFNYVYFITVIIEDFHFGTYCCLPDVCLWQLEGVTSWPVGTCPLSKVQTITAFIITSYYMG